MTEILQTALPYDVLHPKRLPGLTPLNMDDWLLQDEAFAGQLAERDRLLETARTQVLAISEQANPAASELLQMVLSQVYPSHGDTILRRDGVRVPVDDTDPLGTLGRLVQEDFCILQKQGDEHVLTGAVLCFPASWTLSEKFLRPLIAIHDPVDSYNADLARRVQRLFDGIQVGRPLWRFNALWYQDAVLYHPRSLIDRREKVEAEEAPFLRSERQCMVRLPDTGAVVFSIHTYLVARKNVVPPGG